MPFLRAPLIKAKRKGENRVGGKSGSKLTSINDGAKVNETTIISVALTLTIGVGGDAGGLRGRTGPVAIERQHSNGVLCELIESIHLVGGTVHLHALEQQHKLETCVISMRVGWGRRSRQVERR